MDPLRRTSTAALSSSLVLFALGACTHLFQGSPAPGSLGSFPSQNWTSEERDRWYEGSQGSRLIPERWLLALEAPGSEQLFLSDGYFSQFNYLQTPGSPLPLGFARDVQDDSGLNRTRLRWYAGQSAAEPWIGMNCAACHTNDIHYRGTVNRVDGAPTMADFQAFTRSLLEAMQQTYADTPKWDRFAARVLAPRRYKDPSSDTPDNRALLRAAFGSLLSHHRELAEYNATSTVYGPGRLDAVGHIFNKVAYNNEDPQQFRGEPDAPVSYPHIWNISQHRFLQWNGIVENIKVGYRGRVVDAGALVRNTSEVLGVFADITVVDRPSARGYPSSVNTRNLLAMELQLSRLMSPRWPATFPRLDAKLVQRGAVLFKQDCASCHSHLEPSDLTSPAVEKMSPLWGQRPLGTDPWMACNAYTYEARGGLLTGDPRGVLEVIDATPLKERESTATYLQTQAFGALLGRKREVLGGAVRIFKGKPLPIDVSRAPFRTPFKSVAEEQASRAVRLAQCEADGKAAAPGSKQARILAYKARPLNGIWATAPYLHNGSVRTLYDLLLPPDRRPKAFWVGTREFDPVRVGYADQQETNSWRFRVEDEKGPIHGNSNAGHHYRDYTDDADRWALVEYMKSL